MICIRVLRPPRDNEKWKTGHRANKVPPNSTLEYDTAFKEEDRVIGADIERWPFRSVKYDNNNNNKISGQFVYCNMKVRAD